MHKDKEWLETVFEYAPDAFYLNSIEGVFLDGNRAAEKLTGFNREELIGKSFFESGLLPETQIPKATELLSKNRKGESTGPEEIILKKKEGDMIPVEIHTYPVKIKDDIFVLAIARDITKRKAIEEELRASKEVLKRLTVYLQSSREVERAYFARKIHDELGHLLTAVKMDLSMITMNASGKKNKKFQAVINLIDKTIMELNKIISELRPGLLDDLGLAAAIEWQAEDFQRRTGIRCGVNIQLNKIDLEQKICSAMFRIFQELLLNVEQHAGAKRVHVVLRERGGYVLLKIMDDGRGITEKEVNSPFSMGLIEIKEWVEILNGDFKIKGDAGRGTKAEVIIRLPFLSGGEEVGRIAQIKKGR